MEPLTDKVVDRLTLYHCVLTHTLTDRPFVASQEVAALLKLNDSQVRKDIALCGVLGRQKHGYPTEELKRAIEKGEKPNNIMVYAADLTPELEAALIACGFENYASQTSMSLSLPVKSRPRAEIVPIDSDTIADWTNTLNEAMGVDPSPVSFYANLLPSDDAVLYGIRDNGHIVSTLMVCFFDGLPCIHECSTLPETRGKGYVSDLVRAACIEASRRGYDTMYLQASAMGEPVYARLGFQPDGTIRHWKLG